MLKKVNLFFSCYKEARNKRLQSEAFTQSTKRFEPFSLIEFGVFLLVALFIVAVISLVKYKYGDLGVHILLACCLSAAAGSYLTNLLNKKTN